MTKKGITKKIENISVNLIPIGKNILLGFKG